MEVGGSPSPVLVTPVGREKRRRVCCAGQVDVSDDRDEVYCVGPGAEEGEGGRGSGFDDDRTWTQWRRRPEDDPKRRRREGPSWVGFLQRVCREHKIPCSVYDSRNFKGSPRVQLVTF